ncbi:hypothetical protein OKW47_000717 [Paraburkholderia atlantica]
MEPRTQQSGAVAPADVTTDCLASTRTAVGDN